MQPVKRRPVVINTLRDAFRHRLVLTGPCSKGHPNTLKPDRLGTVYGEEKTPAEIGPLVRCKTCNARGLKLSAVTPDGSPIPETETY
ncbi:MAG: hypothetical protein KG075_07670 [Alphaproteobacteria bacterium]|nr:hypothetical protein [Alphaproteobacteria bacterium]